MLTAWYRPLHWAALARERHIASHYWAAGIDSRARRRGSLVKASPQPKTSEWPECKLES
jgi:hypothetical protein